MSGIPSAPRDVSPNWRDERMLIALMLLALFALAFTGWLAIQWPKSGLMDGAARADAAADYGKDPANLLFAPIKPEIAQAIEADKELTNPPVIGGLLPAEPQSMVPALGAPATRPNTSTHTPTPGRASVKPGPTNTRGASGSRSSVPTVPAVRTAAPSTRPPGGVRQVNTPALAPAPAPAVTTGRNPSPEPATTAGRSATHGPRSASTATRLSTRTPLATGTPHGAATATSVGTSQSTSTTGPLPTATIRHTATRIPRRTALPTGTTQPTRLVVSTLTAL